MLKPFFLMHNAMRLLNDPTSLDFPLYWWTECKNLRLKTENESRFRSDLRKSLRTYAHTFSCGFKSGEVEGQSGRTRKPCAPIAF